MGKGKRQKLALVNTPKWSKPNLIMYIKFYREERRGTKKTLAQPKQYKDQLGGLAGPETSR